MGIFNKIKNLFSKEEKTEDIVKEEVKIYEKGLTKSRENFVSKLIDLTGVVWEVQLSNH